VLKLPIAHGEGRYVAPPETLDALERNGRVVFRYCEADSSISELANPNGSLANIAGIMSEGGNVVGLMPHPERAAEAELLSQDGLPLLRALVGIGAQSPQSEQIAVAAPAHRAAGGAGSTAR
jgi:phosphoribosylformylglycinamidine synthase